MRSTEAADERVGAKRWLGRGPDSLVPASVAACETFDHLTPSDLRGVFVHVKHSERRCGTFATRWSFTVVRGVWPQIGHSLTVPDFAGGDRLSRRVATPRAVGRDSRVPARSDRRRAARRGTYGLSGPEL